MRAVGAKVLLTSAKDSLPHLRPQVLLLRQRRATIIPADHGAAGR